MGTGLPDKLETQAFQCPAQLVPGKVTGQFHAN
jgi:hypothetical protein